MTISILYISLLFAADKLSSVLQKRNPSVNTYLREEAYSVDDMLSTKDENFMMAFAIESYYSSKNLIDSRYTKFYA